VDKTLFSSEVKSLMFSIWSYFIKTNNNELLKLLYKECSQIKVKESKFISYQYADQLLLARFINHESLTKTKTTIVN